MSQDTVNNPGGGWRRSPLRLAMWGGAALALLVPLAAMQVLPKMDWTAFDFAFLGALLAAVGLGVELAARTGSVAYRTGAALALGAAFLLVLINGAVGIIGSEQQDANLLFLGVIAVALAGAVVARFRRAGMAWAMTAAALAQLLVPVAAWALGWASPAALMAPEVPASTVVFTGIWLASAWLFRKAAQA